MCSGLFNKIHIKNVVCTHVVRMFSNSNNWKSTIGLEIHAQISSNSKLFSGATYAFGMPPNMNVNLLDAGVPGTLPIINGKCALQAAFTSLALSCKVNEISYFDRKHYFYADLPCGFQITQQFRPIAVDGYLDYYVFNPGVHKIPYKKRCRLKQIQIEQDSGKSLHDEDRRVSLIDLNRAGTGLMEFVFEPDVSDGEEAAALVKELVLILQRLGSCSCKMEEGVLRVDANISISNDPNVLGVRTEVKNIGSIRGVANAIQYEIDRQLAIVKNGGFVKNETRGWDPVKKETIRMRDKDDEHDYRFMPEPNLPPLRICTDETREPVTGELDARHLIRTLPQLPEDSRKHLIEFYKFSVPHALMLVNQPRMLSLFNKIMEIDNKRSANLVWNILMVQLLNVLNNRGISIEACSIEAKALGQVTDLLETRKINHETSRDIIEIIISTDAESPLELVQSRGWFLVSDSDRVEELCRQVIERNPKAVKKVKKGKDRALQTLVNDVANITQDKIDLSLVAKRLKQLIVD